MRNFKVAMLGAMALLGLATIAAAATPAKAPVPAPATASCPLQDLSTQKYSGNDCDPKWRLFDNVPFLRDHRITFDGWLSGGFMANADTPNSRFNGPVGYTDTDKLRLNQGYLSLARTAPDDNRGFFLGGRVDGFYGSDFFFTTASGLDSLRAGGLPRWNNPDFSYGWSIPQVYLAANYNDLQVKLGHFYSGFGNESAMARDNFFNTHSLAFMYGSPLTDSGLLVSKPLNAYWKLSAGIVDSGNQFAANTSNGGRNLNNFLGRLAYTDARFGAALNVQSGKDSDFNVPGIGPYSNRTVVNPVATFNITDRLNYVFDATYGEQRQTLGFNALNSKTARWYGINQQLLYTFNKQWSAGARLEWFDDKEGYLITGVRPFNPDGLFRLPGSFYDASLGVNYKPVPNLTLRGEVREDWTHTTGFVAPAIPAPPPNNQAYGDFSQSNQFLFGLNALVQF